MRRLEGMYRIAVYFQAIYDSYRGALRHCIAVSINAMFWSRGRCVRGNLRASKFERLERSANVDLWSRPHIPGRRNRHERTNVHRTLMSGPVVTQLNHRYSPGSLLPVRRAATE